MSDRLLLPPWAVAVAVATIAIAGISVYVVSLPPGPREAPTLQPEAATGAIPVGAPRRTGTPAPIPVGEPVERGPCTWLLRAPQLAALSDKGLLDHAGLLDASPVEVLRGDAPLRPHARGSSCDDGAAHGPLGVFVRPADGQPTGPWTLRWSAEVRTEVRAGAKGQRPVLWVAPGTTLEIPVDAAWNPAWGAAVVRLAGVASEARGAATLSWGGATAEVRGTGGPLRATVTGAGLDAPSVITVTSPADGPGLALTDVVVGDGPGAVAAVGTLAGATAPLPEGAAGDGPRATVTRNREPTPEPLTLGKADAGCRHTVRRPDLEPLSDLRLFERFGWIGASPFVVHEDGQPLVAHDRGEGCTGASAHPPTALVVRPTGTADGKAYTLGWGPPEVELATKGQGHARVGWAVPGTITAWTYPAPLVAEPHEVVVDLVAFGGSGATVGLGDDRRPVAADAEARVALPGPASGPWSVTIEVPAGGSPVAVRGIEARPAR